MARRPAATALAVAAFAVCGRAEMALLSEDFESADVGQTPPAGWGTDLVSGANYTFYQSAGSWPASGPHSGMRFVEFQSFNAGIGVANRLKLAAPLCTFGCSNVAVEFAWLTDPGYPGMQDRVDVQYSTDGSSWRTVTTVYRYGTNTQWTTQRVALPNDAAGQAALRIGFLFTSGFGNNCHLDSVRVKAEPGPFRVTAVSHRPSEAVVRFESSTNLVYGLQWTDDLLGGDWTNLPDVAPVPGNGGIFWLADTNASATRQRYYRVQAQLR